MILIKNKYFKKSLRIINIIKSIKQFKIIIINKFQLNFYLKNKNL